MAENVVMMMMRWRNRVFEKALIASGPGTLCLVVPAQTTKPTAATVVALDDFHDTAGSLPQIGPAQAA